MNINVTSVVLGLGLAAGLAGTAVAGGSYSDIGIKTYRDAPAAVPVPAPAPVPVSPVAWYLRADIGVGVASKPSTVESGRQFGTSDSPGPANTVASPTPFGTNPAWFDNDFSTFVSGGVGVGYNWGRGFRTDATAEMRSHSTVTGSGTYSYAEHALQVVPPAVVATWTPTGNTVTGNFYETTKVSTYLFMANGYYDFTSWGRLTPYVGAGVGFTYNEYERHQTLKESGGAASTSTDDAIKTHNYGLAAAGTVGVSYAFTPSILLDMNYRYLWLQGANVDLKTSRLAISDYGEHAFRTGVRFNID